MEKSKQYMNDNLIFFAFKRYVSYFIMQKTTKISYYPYPIAKVNFFYYYFAKKGKIIIIMFQSTTNDSKPTIKIAIVNHPSFVVSFI